MEECGGAIWDDDVKQQTFYTQKLFMLKLEQILFAAFL